MNSSSLILRQSLHIGNTYSLLKYYWCPRTAKYFLVHYQNVIFFLFLRANIGLIFTARHLVIALQLYDNFLYLFCTDSLLHFCILLPYIFVTFLYVPNIFSKKRKMEKEKEIEEESNAKPSGRFN